MNTIRVRFEDEAVIIANLGGAHLHRMREGLIKAFKAAHPGFSIRRVGRTCVEVESVAGHHPIFAVASSMQAAPGIPADVCVDYRGIDDDDNEGDGYWSDLAAYRNLYN
jgi:hypothetical protein